jgi:hypothetical protein
MTPLHTLDPSHTLKGPVKTPLPSKRQTWQLCLALTLLVTQGCNLVGLIGAANLGNGHLTPLLASGSITQPPPAVRVGYFAWVELNRESAVNGGQLQVDLLQGQTVAFEQSVEPRANQYELFIRPTPRTAQGIYVVMAWDDTNGNGVYEAQRNERRAPEVYRISGHAAADSLWSAERLVFTEQRFSITYADLRQKELGFTF